MSDNQNKPNIFARVLIGILGTLIISLIVAKFYFFDPKAEISNGIIILLGLLIIVFLSEIFDSFSLGQFLTLKRTIKEKEEKITDLKESNDKLLNIVITNNSFAQKQSLTNVNGISTEEFTRSIISVIKADKETREKEESGKEKIYELAEEEIPKKPRKRFDFQKMRNWGVTKFIDNKDFRKYNFIEDAQILMPQKDLDPINIDNPVFDGYVETENFEVFLSVKLRSSMYMLNRDRLYVMLSKLYYYRLAKKTNVYLNLILVDRPEDTKGNLDERIIKDFEPAIRSGLLKLDYYEINEKDMAKMYVS
jgi:hypothetical protein